MLHCEVLQLPHSIGCGHCWCSMPGIGMCVCVCVCEVAKMSKDIGMTIRKGIVVSYLPCLVAFWGFHPYYVLSFFLMFFCYLFLLFFGGRRKV